MIRSIFTLLLANLLLICSAQISQKGTPWSFTEKNRVKAIGTVQFETVEATNVDKFIAEDISRDKVKDQPWRFGENIDVEYDIRSSGQSEYLPNGNKIWKLGIFSPGALSINLTFDHFYLPKGARLYIYTVDTQFVIGAFTNENNQSDGVFATCLLPGEKVIIEYNEPYKVDFPGEFKLVRVTHGYRNAFEYAEKSFGSSGSCNMNVKCPQTAGWENEINSAVMLVSGSNGFCSGTLVNNTAEDGTPYILTANHCYSNPANWLFYFNWQSPTCSNPGSSPSFDAVSGSVLKAKNADSDFCLVEMNSAPPQSYGAFYAGWNSENVAPTSQVGIHHPAGDIKKFSIDHDPATSDLYLGTSGLADSHWKIDIWDENTTTEGGSSGSALFDQNHRIIGQLHGGYAACGNTESDWYGKFSMSWDRGGTPENELSDWLDPQGTGLVAIDGYDPYTPTSDLDARIISIIYPESYYCSSDSVSPSVIIQNKGTSTLFTLYVIYAIDSLLTDTVFWSGSLATNSTDTVVFPPFYLPIGLHTFTAYTFLPNDSSDLNNSNDTLFRGIRVLDASQTLGITITQDRWGTETTWKVVDNSAGNILLTGGPYGNLASNATIQHPVDSICVGEGCYTFIIYDAYSDGMCCESGSGGFLVENLSTGQSYGSGGDFVDSAVVQFCISISGSPVVDFTASSIVVPVGSSVDFTDLSAGPPTLWNWTFTGGTPDTSSAQHPATIVYTTPGTYDVKLVTYNAFGSDSLVKTGYIVVYPCYELSTDITMGFESGEDMTGWDIVNSNGDAKTWQVLNSSTYAHSGSNSMYYTYHDSNPADDWLFTKCLNLSKDSIYQLSYYYRVRQAAYPEKLRVTIGESANPVNQTDTLRNFPNLTNTTYLMDSSLFSVSSSGTYNIGFQVYSNVDMYNLYLDDIQIITIGTLPLAGFTIAQNLICSGESTIFSDTSSNNPTSWEWYFEGGTPDSSFQQDPGVITYTNPGLFDVQLTVGNFEGTTTQLQAESITVISPEVVAAVINPSCADSLNGSVELDVSGIIPFSYTWSIVESTDSLIIGLGAGNYSFTVTDSAGCVVVDSVDLIAPSPISIVLQSMPISCTGDSNGVITAFVSGGTPGYNYLWNNGGTIQSINGLDADQYSLSVTDLNFCYSEIGLTLVQPDSLMIYLMGYDATDTTPYNGWAELYASGGTPPYSYLWNDPDSTTNDTLQLLASGTYTVVVADASGCSVSDSVSISYITNALMHTKPLSFEIYPNPTSGKIFIKGPVSDAGINIEIVDVVGKLLIRQEKLAYPIVLDLVGLEEGMYFIRIEMGNMQSTLTFILTRE